MTIKRIEQERLRKKSQEEQEEMQKTKIMNTMQLLILQKENQDKTDDIMDEEIYGLIRAIRKYRTNKEAGEKIEQTIQSTSEKDNKGNTVKKSTYPTEKIRKQQEEQKQAIRINETSTTKKDEQKQQVQQAKSAAHTKTNETNVSKNKEQYATIQNKTQEKEKTPPETTPTLRSSDEELAAHWTVFSEGVGVTAAAECADDESRGRAALHSEWCEGWMSLCSCAVTDTESVWRQCILRSSDEELAAHWAVFSEGVGVTAAAECADDESRGRAALHSEWCEGWMSLCSCAVTDTESVWRQCILRSSDEELAAHWTVFSEGVGVTAAAECADDESRGRAALHSEWCEGWMSLCSCAVTDTESVWRQCILRSSDEELAAHWTVFSEGVGATAAAECADDESRGRAALHSEWCEGWMSLCSCAVTDTESVWRQCILRSSDEELAAHWTVFQKAWVSRLPLSALMMRVAVVLRYTLSGARAG
ncbi:unnamed protein product [Trypanosoma congolense IL3000]|uniref:WGS project CAEQ00000000 data, annotated contig 1073 n=1 Tax=Trypanosoma congolense (strain IL3000) TaxID=1068625 RepID=F9W3L3_TRYCI|nr:unnamed protein product [Trypanosoma congolense IL3000]